MTSDTYYAALGAPLSSFVNDEGFVLVGAPLSVFANDVNYTAVGSLVSQFVNDASYTVSGSPVSQFANDASYTVSGSPVSQFVNDAGYVTASLTMHLQEVSSLTFNVAVLTLFHVPAGDVLILRSSGAPMSASSYTLSEDHITFSPTLIAPVELSVYYGSNT